ncbi:MAG: hypothetical protein Q9167_002199 [Letrouitia subvulpina]
MDSGSPSPDVIHVLHDRQPQTLRKQITRAVDIAYSSLSKSQEVDAGGNVNASADLSKSQEVDTGGNVNASAGWPKNQAVDAVANVSTSAIASQIPKPNRIHPNADHTRKGPEEEVLFDRSSPDRANVSACSSSYSTNVPKTNLSTLALDIVDQQPCGETAKEGSQVSRISDLLTISTEEGSQGDHADAPERLVYGHLSREDPFRTTFMMVIHKPNGQTLNRVAKLDTAAGENVISQQVVDKLGIPVNDYTGRHLLPVGDPIYPKGRVSLEWHAAGKSVTYKTSFAVLQTSLCKHFDILLSEKEIRKIGFFKVDNTIFFLDSSDDGMQRRFKTSI